MEISDDNYGGAVWSCIECNIGVVCASMPTFKALFDRFFPSLMGYNRDPSKNSGSYGSAPSKRNYTQRLSQSDIELERGIDWDSPYSGNSNKDKLHSCNATAGSQPAFRKSTSNSNLKGNQSQDDGGIWKVTSVVVSR